MSLGIIATIFSAFVGLVCFRRIKPTFFRIIVFLLFLTAGNEIAMPYVSTQVRYQFYNYYSLVEISVWVTVFFLVRRKNRYILLFGILVVILSIVEIAVLKGFHSYSYRLFSIFVILNVLSYFRTLTDLKVVHSLGSNGFFWMACGALLFQTFFLFYLTALDYPEFRNDKGASKAFKEIIYSVNIMYYILQSIGLVCFSFIHHSHSYSSGEV